MTKNEGENIVLKSLRDRSLVSALTASSLAGSSLEW
jgi:hypothetical protein